MPYAERRAALDEAIRAFVQAGKDDGDYGAATMVVGWTLGVATVSYDDDGGECDGDIIECAPGMHMMFRRGLAEHSAERFAATCWPDGDDDD